MINRDMIDIRKLVDSIHAAEAAQRNGTWTEYAKANGLVRTWGKFVYAFNYVQHVTGLYTLRAWLRGRLHRKNPPEEIRDYNRSVQEQGLKRPLKEWDAVEHNRKIAEQAAPAFLVQEPPEVCANGA